MKTLISASFGAAALAASLFASATPADARSNVGIYVGPGGAGISVVDYRYGCRDYWYRRNHPYRCGYGGYYSERYYYPRYHYYYDNDYRYRYRHYRHHHRDRDWDDRRHRRW